ncbi:hypothetical protein GCM10010211_16310 [Streptomyces albospinus]|uniref:ScoMcrA-like DNA sulfur-binding domain-containing protein n=1 Tax=Streptomyces albospinus TaxID=285515 RepID=A0ABQ2UW09_9ACTN|nr:hypothetical protein GCM10010211_16310 [Streptomyces albospinus]
MRYGEVEGELKRLLTEYGPSHPTPPAYPFHHLVSDGVWEVRTDQGPGSPGSRVGLLRSSGATWRRAPGLRAALAKEPSLLRRLARVLLDTRFPPSLHMDLCEAAGLDLELAETESVHGAGAATRRQRDRRMRELILTAYELQADDRPLRSRPASMAGGADSRSHASQQRSRVTGGGPT